METSSSTIGRCSTPSRRKAEYASLQHLPAELHLQIVQDLFIEYCKLNLDARPSVPLAHAVRDLASVARSCRSLFSSFDSILYNTAAASLPTLLFWACAYGHDDLVEKLLRVGANPNRALVSSRKTQPKIRLALEGRPQLYRDFSSPFDTYREVAGT
ncbi:hypothetical protein B0T22DRAFT_437465 [Podospora appendiculata]|uniref:Ankyrin repeat protein n=1 Tax=Podospora appendiculata TaxID=314037 RepID=A0AAE0XJE2_9PEZI|nr:hypothetical protein B0T22DRAFT_437465 [Podospora appendiculata]